MFIARHFSSSSAKVQGGRAGSGQRTATTFALPSLLILGFGKIALMACDKARMEWKQTASSFYDFEGEKRAATASTSSISDTRSKNSWSGLPFCLTPIRTDQSPPVTGTGMA